MSGGPKCPDDFVSYPNQRDYLELSNSCSRGRESCWLKGLYPDYRAVRAEVGSVGKEGDSARNFEARSCNAH
jgi:hypothetical protein